MERVGGMRVVCDGCGADILVGEEVVGVGEGLGWVNDSVYGPLIFCLCFSGGKRAGVYGMFCEAYRGFDTC